MRRVLEDESVNGGICEIKLYVERPVMLMEELYEVRKCQMRHYKKGSQRRKVSKEMSITGGVLNIKSVYKGSVKRE